MWTWGWGPCGQYISNKRPSRFVILSAAKDLCRARDPERSEGSLSGERSFAALRMTNLKRLRLTQKTSYLQCIGPCGCLFVPILFICNVLALVATRPRLLLYNRIIWRFSTQEAASFFCRLAAQLARALLRVPGNMGREQ